jgi:hypothetical protein
MKTWLTQGITQAIRWNIVTKENGASGVHSTTVGKTEVISAL